MAEIVISEFMDEAIVARAFAGRDYTYDPTLVDRPEDLAAALSDSRALIVRNRTQVRAPLLAHGPKLRVVGRLGVGLDNIDQAACAARGVAVIPATGANDLAVAEYVIAAALILLRRVWFASSDVVAGRWPRMALIGREAASRSMGFVGFGAIARETAHRARALGMAVLAHDPHVPEGDPAWAGATRTSLRTVLAESDVVSLHVPLTDETRGMIDAEALALMKPDAVLINSARGGVVDEDALVAALKAGALGGAALDVFDVEPLDAIRGARFRDTPNLLLTPHIAGVTEDSNLRVSALIATKVLEVLDGAR
jgi:(S)-sulfolactate dehydrogenase